MSMRRGSYRSSRSSRLSLEVKFWHLCTNNVRIIADLVGRGNLLNRRQCVDLSIKLTAATRNIEELVLHGRTSPDLFQLPLENFYRSSEKARLLVQSCGKREWWIAAVFQIQNEDAFQEIILDISLSYNAIYEQAKSLSEDWSIHPEDLRESTVFRHSTDNEMHKLDQLDIQKRLKELATAPNKLVTVLNRLMRRKRSLKQRLAQYLLVKLKYIVEQTEAGSCTTFDACSEFLWSKESEPSGTWGSSFFLGAGATVGGVCKTKWLGVLCAKKVFQGQESEGLFLKEAGILAQLNHPHVVKFICCGNGQDRGDRFIAMELMEDSLFNLIEDQKSQYFPINVVVDLIMQIARGMCYLHSRGVAHRDLKPHNVVVTRLPAYSGHHFCLKLVDFGMSKSEVQVSISNAISMRGVGTTIYRAPEVHPDANPNGEGRAIWFKADIYSFAMTCAHLLSVKIPSKDVRPPELPLNCPEELVELLRDCWRINPRSRPSFLEVCLRLEKLKYKISRGLFTSVDHQGRLQLNGGQANFDVGLNFIRKKMEELFFYRKPLVNVPLDDAPQGENYRNDHVRQQNVACSSHHSFELLPLQSSSQANCIICSNCKMRFSFKDLNSLIPTFGPT